MTTPQVICTICEMPSASTFEVPISPVPDLFHLNRGLHPSEAESVYKVIQDGKAAISDLASKIARAQSLVFELQQQERQLEKHVQQHQRLVSSLWRLPLEVLSDIFVYSSLDDLEKSWMSIPRQRRAIMQLSHICRHWRSAALLTPSLWSVITLEETKPWKASEEALIVETWLSRVADRPISLKLGNYLHEKIPSVKVALAHCSQWQILDVPMSSMHSVSSAKGKLSSLRTLFLSGEGQYLYKRPMSTFESAPQLRTVTLGYYIPYPKIKLPWSQLTEIYMPNNFYNLEDCILILQQASNLERCKIKFLSRFDQGPPHSPSLITRSPVRLDRLLVLHCIILGEPTLVFDHLTLPALRELEISVVKTFPPCVWCSRGLAPLLRRSSCNLQKLTIGLEEYPAWKTLPPSDDDFLCCLEYIPTLVELELIRRYSTKCFTTKSMKRLTSEDSNPNVLLPNLRILRIFHGNDFDDDALADMIESRCNLGSVYASGKVARCIDTVELVGLEEGVRLDGQRGSHSLTPNALTRLGRLADAGLDIYALDENGEKISLKPEIFLRWTHSQ